MHVMPYLYQPSAARRRLFVCLLLVAGCLMATDALAVRGRSDGAGPASREGADDETNVDFKANDLLNKGLDLLGSKEEERGLKLIASVPQLFPKSKVRFKAYLAVGRYQVDKRQYDLAAKQFAHLGESEDADEQAEGLYQLGVCKYNLNSFDGAFMDLRRVTNEHPWSVFANESYYYIGQCHFKLGRWAKAIEAMEMVGTSVPANDKGTSFAEAGQRLCVKVRDKDLVVLAALQQKCTVAVKTRGGDKESLTLEPLGRGGDCLIGSLPTEPGEPVPGDGKLQIVGGDEATVEYLDSNTEAGTLDQKVLATVRLASTASIGFTDGAYREYTSGVFADNEAFMRVKDMDRDMTPERDKITVTVRSEYKVAKEEPKENAGVDVSGQDEKIEIRDGVEVKLTETGPHTGIFVGTVIPYSVASDDAVNKADDRLSVMKGDTLVLQYRDELHMLSREPRDVLASAKLLIGRIQDVKIEQRVVDSLDLKARKNLIEAKIYLKLATIFKEVGLTNKAAEKADEGLARVDEVISTSLKASLDSSLVEEAFSVKWDLFLAKDKLAEAIQVCRTLTQLFPDSSLVDQALLKIGMAKMEGPNPHEAIGIFNALIALPKSDLKAQAQYNIAATLEKIATRDAEARGHEPALENVILSYKKCAEVYPESPFAGDSLDKIVNYYINTKDYPRAVELMERVFQDYPDASFLDRMLLRWIIASYRMGDYATAKEKAEQLISEYPNSKQAEKARVMLDTINKKL